MSKLTSRKFWISVAAFLASAASAIAGFATNNAKAAAVGTLCAMLSAGIYAACEAYVDGQDAASSNLTVQASTTSKEVVEQLLRDDSESESASGSSDED